jgi:glycosyltransferase involved in cell wall biosynthesis
MLGSVVIPAHNEATVVRRCLDALFDGLDPSEIEAVVVCNGCVDDTAARARSAGDRVRVLELPQASKPAALRAGEAAVASFPRLYLDADVVLGGSAARAVLERLAGGAVAARPPIEYDTARSSWLVRRYFGARARIPAVNRSLWGAGVYGLSADARARFGEFPDLVGDDLWVDRHFLESEVEVVDTAPVRVAAPRRARDLVRILRRTYRAKAEGRPAESVVGDAPNTAVSTVRDLARLFASGPRASLDAVVYSSLAVAGRVAVALTPASGARWERDDSSRV